MPENRSQAIGFVHLSDQAVASTAVTDECLAQTFARLSGAALTDSVANRPTRIMGTRGYSAVYPSVPTGCVRVRVVIRPSSSSRVEANVRKLDEDLAVEAESLAEYFSAVRRTR